MSQENVEIVPQGPTERLGSAVVGDADCLEISYGDSSCPRPSATRRRRDLSRQLSAVRGLRELLRKFGTSLRVEAQTSSSTPVTSVVVHAHDGTEAGREAVDGGRRPS